MRGVPQRLLTIAVLLWSSSTLCAQGISWLSSWPEASQLAQRNQRLVLIHFTSQNCAPCAQLERTVLKRPEVIRALTSNYVPLRVDVDQSPDVARHFRVQQWPTDLILDAQGKELYRATSSLDPNRFIATLDQVAAHARIGAPFSGSPSTDTVATPGAEDGATRTAAGLGSPATTVRQPLGPRGGEFQPPGGGAVGNQSGGEFVTNQYVPNQPGPQHEEQLASYDARGGQFPAGAVAPANGMVNQPPQGPTMSAATSQLRQPSVPQAELNQFALPQGAHTAGAPSVAQAPAGPPTLAMDGYCCVTLVEQEKWVKGDPQFGAFHRGRTYLFADSESQRRFMSEFDKYAPALSGYDCVKYAETGALIDGRRAHGVFYRGQIFLFADEEALQKFWANPNQFLPAVLAERQRQVMQR